MASQQRNANKNLMEFHVVMVALKQVCGVCSMMGHVMNMCPSLMNLGGLEQANALGGFQRQQRQTYDPYSNNYIAGWRDHPHLKWNNQDNGEQSVPNNYNRPPGFFQARPHPPFQPQQQQAPSKSLEDLIASLANSTQSHQQKIDKPIENLERQMSHGKEVFEQPRMQKRTRKDINEQGELQTKNLEQDEVSTETKKSPKATELNKKDSDKRKLPPKLKDIGSFTIPCVIGGKEFGRALSDLGASINLISYSIYSKGLLEDVLVQVNELIFSADYFVLEMEHDPMPTALPLILGRPFLRMARTKIDVYDGTLTMEIDGESVKFRIFNAMRHLKLELKPIPEHLKYAFLGEDKTLPIIISSQLIAEERDKLMRVLKDHKTAIAWSIADIKGINPTTCMHRILLEEGTKPTREAQSHLNPFMTEVIKQEVIKLLDVGIIYPIYPISDSNSKHPKQSNKDRLIVDSCDQSLKVKLIKASSSLNTSCMQKESE
ncbi:unnamed protein product [Malus baccata var. baccata]